jgi:hypothetical protein
LGFNKQNGCPQVGIIIPNAQTVDANQPHLATSGFAGFRPTVYGRQPFFSGKEAVVRNPAVYRCNSKLFSSCILRKPEWALSYPLMGFPASKKFNPKA